MRTICEGKPYNLGTVQYQQGAAGTVISLAHACLKLRIITEIGILYIKFPSPPS
jgi:hypothetical protein